MTDLIPWLNQSILSSLIFCPIIGAILVALLPRKVAREGAFVVALINFVLSLHLVAHWNDAGVLSEGGFRFEENAPWMPGFGVNYHLGVDGLSVLMVILTAFLTPIVMLASWRSVAERAKEYFVLLLLLAAAAIGAFSALDVILFYVFFEATLIPTYILIAGWGGPRRSYAALKFFLFTMAGSVLMWLAMLYLYFRPESNNSFDYAAMQSAALAAQAGGGQIGLWLFIAFAVAFAIKAPLFPLHTWQPDAYQQSPTAATVMLAAVLSKMGVYGFLRFAIPFFPDAAQAAAPVLIVLAIIGIIYGAMAAIAQSDIKRVLAYSSLSHVALILLGVFAAVLAGENGVIANTGATLQMVNHGLSTGALFLLAGWLFERRGTLQTGELGGLAKVMPRYTVMFWVAMFASIGLPGLNGFVGEYLILQGTMAAGFWYAFFGATAVVLGAIYMLRMFRTAMYGDITREENRTVRDISPRETLAIGLVLAVIVWIGVAPQKFLDLIRTDASQATAVAQLPDNSR